MQPMLHTAIQAVRSAGRLIVTALDRLDTLEVTHKGKYNVATEIDRAAELDIIKTIKNIYPRHAILAEESGKKSGDEYEWIIDPLDGTTNFVHGYPHFCISIGIKSYHTNHIEHGVIYDPIRNELFTASRGRSAQLNNRRLRVTSASTLDNCLISFNYPNNMDVQQLDHNLLIAKVLQTKMATYRRSGSAALDLAYVACGRLDGCYATGLAIWDIAAGSLIIREAGGLVGDIQGGENFLETGNIVAANPKIFAALLQGACGGKL